MRILVLGDSSSAGIGGDLQVYPYRLFKRLERSRFVELQNHSSPGLTSADAARYFQIRLSKDRWDAVVVYLGNNDGGPGVHKGRYRPLWDRLGLGCRRSVRSLPPPPGTPREFHLSDDVSMAIDGPAATPAEFGQNLSHIVNLARARGAHVVLINPLANRAYPASVGPVLSPFFKIIRAASRIGHLVKPEGEAATLIRDAICAEEQGRFDRALSGYETILSSRFSSPFLLQVAFNNLAVLLHHLGRSSDAEAILSSQARAGDESSSIASYNLARLMQHQGRRADADKWFGVAAEQDAHLYRIKDAYRDAVGRIAACFGVRVLDLATLLTRDGFVDYCHPTAEAHDEIAAAVHSALHCVAPPSHESGESRYESHYPSPSAFEFCDDDLLDYYDITPELSAGELQDGMSQVAAKLQCLRTESPLRALKLVPCDSAVQSSIVGALTYVAAHPIVTCVDDICRWPVRNNCELGRLPEHYVYRLLLNYFEWGQTHRVSSRMGDDDIDASDLCLFYRRLMIGRPEIDAETPVNTSDSYRRRLRGRVLRAVRHPMLFHDVRVERMTTVLRWYTREAFRYGTQSRLSMLYPVAALDSIAEALRVWMVIARFRNAHDDECLIRVLYAWLRGLERIHANHARRFISQTYSSSQEDRRQFTRELLLWRMRLPRSGPSH